MAYPPHPRDERSGHRDREASAPGYDEAEEAVWPSRTSRAPQRRPDGTRTGEWARPSGEWARPSGEWSRPSGEQPRTGSRTGEWAGSAGSARSGEWARTTGPARSGEWARTPARTTDGPHTGGIPRQRSAPPATGWGRSTSGRRPFVPPRKRSGGKIFMIFLGFCLVFCAGALYIGADKIGKSYPATVTLPDELAGLARIEDKDLQAGADEVVAALRSGTGIKHAVAGVFAKEGDDQHPIMIFAGDGFLLRPEQVLATGMRQMNTDGFGFGEPMAVSAGPQGGVAKCAMGTLQADDKTEIDLVLCGWADYGSVGMACFINSKEAAAAAEQLLAIRDVVETH